MCLSSNIEERKVDLSSWFSKSPNKDSQDTLNQNPEVTISKQELIFEKSSTPVEVTSKLPKQEFNDIPLPTLQASWLLQDNVQEAADKPIVHHNYHDYAGAREIDSGFIPGALFSKGGVAVPFPVKLFEMLEAVEHDPNPKLKVVQWQPHGRSFIVTNQKEFTTRVLPDFFLQKKYASFQRQLNLYGFKRITKGPDRGSYYHELFLRGKKFLTRNINRIKIKGNGARLASNPDEEPNFYNMSSLPASTDPRKTPPILEGPSTCAQLIPPQSLSGFIGSGSSNSSSSDTLTDNDDCSVVLSQHPDIRTDELENLFFKDEEDASSRATTNDDPPSLESSSLHSNNNNQEHDSTSFKEQMEQISKMVELEQKKENYYDDFNTSPLLNANNFSQEEVHFLLDLLFE